MRVENDILLVLERSTTQGTGLKLPPEQLERPLYVRVAKVIEAAGGKWDRRSGLHIFPGPAADAIEAVMLTGEISKPQDFGFFETGPELVARVIREAQIKPGMECLEPSAGTGRLADAARDAGAHVLCIELQPQNCKALLAKKHSLIPTTDFMAFERPVLPARFDRVVMNPPFSRGQDAKHILHAYSMLKPDGRLVAIASAGVLFRQDRVYQQLRDLAGECGSMERLPDGSFKAAGTMVATALVILDGEDAVDG